MASVATMTSESQDTSSKASPSSFAQSKPFTSLFACRRTPNQSDKAHPLQTAPDLTIIQSGDTIQTSSGDNDFKVTSSDTNTKERNPPESPYLPTNPDKIPSPTEEKTEELILHHATAFTKNHVAIPATLPKLAKPVIIPRLTKEITSPVVRAWPDDLKQHAITMQDFVAFIDNLNLLSNPPMAGIVLQIAAIGIEFIPFDGADGLAVLTELAAIGISYKTIVTRYSRMLQKVNDEYFHPRALHARLVNTKKMSRSLGIADDDPLIAPLEENTLDMTAHDRCMAHLKQYSAELSYGVPPPSPQTTLLAKIASWNVEKKRKEFERCSKRARKRAWKKHQAGKPLTREGKQEKSRAKKLQWLLIQNLEDFEREQKEDAEAEKQKKTQREEKRRMRRLRSWPLSRARTNHQNKDWRTTSDKLESKEPTGDMHKNLFDTAAPIEQRQTV